MTWRAATAFVGLCLAAGTAAAQSTGANITLQLPSFSQFGVDTTVIVPDGGSASLGGDRAAAIDSKRWSSGLGTSRSMGAARRSVQAQVNAKIHDPDKAEAALRAAVDPEGRAAAGKGTTPVGRMTSDPAAKSVAELARQRERDESARDLQARVLFEKGRRAQQAGKASLAATYYRTSAAQASPELQKEIDAQQRTLVQGLAGSRPTK